VSDPTQKFGPFLIPADYPILEAGWRCLRCRKQVRKLFKMVPNLISRAVFYNCACGTVVAWEDESQPKDSQQWRLNIKLLRKSGCEVAIFNGNRPLAPGFGGLN